LFVNFSGTVSDFGDRGGAAVVAGGSGAIGAAIARTLAARGSTVAVIYRSNEKAAAEVVDSIRKAGGKAEAFRVDLTDSGASADFLKAVGARFGGIHTVVYAAGPALPMNYVMRISSEQFGGQMIADAMAFYNLVQPAIPFLRESKGAIVALSTTAVTRVVPRDLLSVGPKAVVESITHLIAVEEGRFGIRANCVAVGMTADGIGANLIETGGLDERALEVVRNNTPLRKFGDAEDVAEAVCFLASDRADFITGQTLVVDGGYSA
jgi:NAD(P)-dependent dehydrogenase (short-subunit alcohol dehydrogenase family)